METTVITTIITVMGVATITMLGYFMQSVRTEMRNIRTDMQGIRTDIRYLGERIDRLDEKTDKRFGVLEEKVNALTANVAAIAATQTAHGNKLNQMVNLGERVAAVEGAVFNKPATKLALAASIEPNE
ncbi:MAG: hypothetical protein KTU85_08145 [Acidimicrobiia bacterium]|nr:hypothetical protein [Acidimicrobiia bacterium]